MILHKLTPTAWFYCGLGLSCVYIPRTGPMMQMSNANCLGHVAAVASQTSRSHVSKLLRLQWSVCINISDSCGTQSPNFDVQTRIESGQNLYEGDAWLGELFWEVLDVPP